MEVTDRLPSVPPNFVSLQKLQEQRLKEQEEEEEQQRKRQEEEEKRKEEEQRKLKEEERRRDEIKITSTKTSIGGGFYKKKRYKRRWVREGGGESDLKPREGDFEISNTEDEIHPKKSNKEIKDEKKNELRKKKRKEYKMKKKLERAAALAMEEKPPSLDDLNPSAEIKENEEVVNGGKRSTCTSEGGNLKWRKKPEDCKNVKLSGNPTAEIERRISAITVVNDHGVKKRFNGHRRDGRSMVKINGGSRKWLRDRERKGTRDENLVWVKKEESSQ